MLVQDKYRYNFYTNWIFKSFTFFCAILLVAIFFGILFCLVIGSIPSIQKFGLHFLISKEWNPVTDSFGALVPIMGTVLTSIIALMIAIPISFGIAFFLTEICPTKLRGIFGTAIELLAAIPSIIYGMWGLFVFAPFFRIHGQPWLIENLGPLPIIGSLFQGVPLGIGTLSAGIILSIMIIPFIAAIMRDVFNFVPALLKESAYALGATKWEVMWSISLPHARVGVIGGVILGMGRALGETMAVAFVIGNSTLFSYSIINPGTSITAILANEFNEATGKVYTASLINLSLTLFIITFIFLFISKSMLRKFSQES